MTRTVKIITVGLIAVVALLAAACPKRTTIAELQRNPGRFNGKDVTVAGVVRSTYGGGIPGTPIGGGIYEIDDGTGTMWVIAQGNPRNKGAELAVTGTFGNVASWGGRNYGTGISEDKRHYRRR